MSNISNPSSLRTRGPSMAISRHSNVWSRLGFCGFLAVLLLTCLLCQTSEATSAPDQRKDVFAHSIFEVPLIYDTAPSPTAAPLADAYAPIELGAALETATAKWHKDAPGHAGSAPSPTSDSAVPTGIIAARRPSAMPKLPRAFDTTLGTNFSSPKCPQFIEKFINAPEFIECVPISMMLQTSTSFFQATKSFARITQVLDAACSASLSQCSTLLAGYATQLVQPDTCETDYRGQNPIVLQAYNGLVAYAPLYAATCLQTTANMVVTSAPATAPASASPSASPSSTPGSKQRRSAPQTYCFADAVTNTQSPTDAYVYYLPLGVSLPASSTPTCDSCLRQTMSGFVPYAANASQPLSLVYSDAASLIDLNCGPTFARVNVKIVASSDASGLGTHGFWSLVSTASIAAAALWLF